MDPLKGPLAFLTNNYFGSFSNQPVSLDFVLVFLQVMSDILPSIFGLRFYHGVIRTFKNSRLRDLLV